MFTWYVELCLEDTKWYWKCSDNNGSFICWSKRLFDTENEAKRDFERQFEDHLACMRCRFVN